MCDNEHKTKVNKVEQRRKLNHSTYTAVNVSLSVIAFEF